jgi:hypothetical protein
LFWYIFLIFLLSPIAAYAQYLLYIPNQSFRPYAPREGRIKATPEVLIGNGPEAPPEKIGAQPDEPVPRPIHGYGEEKADVLRESSGVSPAEPLSDEDGKGPDDLLRLNG